MDKTILGGLAGLLTLFISGAVFGRLHNSDTGGSTPIGDRVMCGLLALPLIALAVRYALPDINGRWAIVAPAPLAIYVLLLAATGMKAKDVTAKDMTANGKRPNGRLGFLSEHFVQSLILSVGFLYIVTAVIAWFALP